MRTGTPPRSATAQIRLLRICLDERVLGGVEVNELSTLADVRTMVAEDEIAGVPQSYLFLFGGAPVSRRQEARRRAVDCFPFLAIIPEGAHIAHAFAGGDAASPLPPSTQATATFDGPQVQPGGLRVDDRTHSRASVMTQADVQPQPGMPRQSSGDARMSPHHLHGIAMEASGTRRMGSEDARDEGREEAAIGGATLELQITDGPLEGTTVTIGEEGASIGRHTSNTLVIPEAGISRYHCEICYSSGEFCVRDLGSTTGTYFYLRPQAQFQMFPGLMVKLGETEFQVLSQSGTGLEDPEQLVWFYEGPLAGHKAHVPAGGITIGRRHNNSLALVQDGTVSAHHAVIYHEEGEFFISDLGSCNGTCVRLSAERTDSDWHPILDGDVLGAGCTKVRCRVR